jgi:hypothetical protein
MNFSPLLARWSFGSRDQGRRRHVTPASGHDVWLYPPSEQGGAAGRVGVEACSGPSTKLHELLPPTCSLVLRIDYNRTLGRISGNIIPLNETKYTQETKEDVVMSLQRLVMTFGSIRPASKEG